MNISIGQIAFEAYSESMGWKTYDGKDIPQWENLSSEVQKAWGAAARAIARQGGANIGGSINLGGGDFIGRDKIGGR